MQSITIAGFHDLRKDGRELGFKIDERFRGAHAHQAIRIRQRVDQMRNGGRVIELADRHHRSQPHKPYGIARQLAQDFYRVAGLRIGQRTGGGSTQFGQLVVGQPDEFASQRRAGHFSQHSRKDFPQLRACKLQIGEQDLGPFPTAIDQCVLQRKDRHVQPGLSQPIEYFFGGFRRPEPPKSPQRCIPGF